MWCVSHVVSSLAEGKRGQWLVAGSPDQAGPWPAHKPLQPSPLEKEENSYGNVIKMHAAACRAISIMGLKTDRLQLVKMTHANVHSNVLHACVER
jgi:hypothetical protein